MCVEEMKYSIVILPFVFVKRFYRIVVERLFLRMKTVCLSLIWRMNCGSNVRFVGKTIIRAYESGAIRIGDDCKFISGTENNLVGLTNPTVLCAARGAKIEIGNHVGASSVIINAKTSQYNRIIDNAIRVNQQTAYVTS